MAARTKLAFHRLSNIDIRRWVSLHSKNEVAVLYGIWISVREDWIRLKSRPSANDETTYLILVLVEDERRGLPVELDGTSSSIDSLTRRRHVNEDMRVEDGKMSGECVCCEVMGTSSRFRHSLNGMLCQDAQWER